MSSPPPPPAPSPDAPPRPPMSLPNLSASPTVPPHGDGTCPPPPSDATPHLSSPSARTSYTHIDPKPEDEELPHTPAVLQDLRTAPGPTPPLPPPQEQLTGSQDPLEAREPIATSASPSMTTSTEPGIVLPVASTNTTHVSAGGTEESVSSQKVSIQTNQLQQLEPVPRTPQTFLTLLLVSGTRKTMSFEPETAISRVKELIWNTWPTDWQEEKPPAPSYLRVLYLGKMLLDDDTLAKLRIPSSMPNAPHPTIVHLSIRPSNCPGEDGTMKKKRKNSDAPHEPDNMNSSSCCGCVVC